MQGSGLGSILWALSGPTFQAAFQCPPLPAPDPPPWVSRGANWGTSERSPGTKGGGPQSMAGAGQRGWPGVTWPPSLESLPPPRGRDPREEMTSAMRKAQPGNPRGRATPPKGLGRGKGSGRARDVVRGQDGHDDGSNMMRAPNRRLSAPMNKGLKGEGGCVWPRPPALGFPGQRAAWTPQSCKLDTNICNMHREGSQARPSRSQACLAC